ncbi:hypothetical protein SAMN04490243_2015 [Robiginitalea myxolifaciens]|uniref:Outer membrane protein beta-barrel domain-containing protein n=1 Tax=Robiginitalea myxolifaciens TaxID=400055 RepID=A0A1I6H0Q8_9FLAO|nr:tRNA modification GTPase [Robiginitalea myxolifaciens]SFR48043.1 hypothetical protein SAMN04490243_2015 [Robiginitalea myxolifaciens]
MKRIILVLIICLLTSNIYGQISYEKGFYIDNSGQRKDCYIRNVDWKDNPTEFEYRLKENLESKTIGISDVKEFQIDSIAKYVRRTVNIDKSSENFEMMTYERNPVYEEETIFLEVLVEGRASLYRYENGDLVRFFYNTQETDLKQLVYKSYFVTSERINRNNEFRNQLWNTIKCPDSRISKVESLEYHEKDLTPYFINYNECAGSDYMYFEIKKNRDLFNLNIRPGIRFTTLNIQNNLSDIKEEFNAETSLRLGMEVEFILPFNNSKWALFAEPTYQYFKSDLEESSSSIDGVDYKSIEIPVGVRHYFFINKQSKIFINAAYVLDYSIGKSRVIRDFSNDLEISVADNIAFGIGYKHNDKLSLELRYQTTRDILSRFEFWFSEYQTTAIIVGYSIF